MYIYIYIYIYICIAKSDRKRPIEGDVKFVDVLENFTNY